MLRPTVVLCTLRQCACRKKYPKKTIGSDRSLEMAERVRLALHADGRASCPDSGLFTKQNRLCSIETQWYVTWVTSPQLKSP